MDKREALEIAIMRLQCTFTECEDCDFVEKYCTTNSRFKDNEEATEILKKELEDMEERYVGCSTCKYEKLARFEEPCVYCDDEEDNGMYEPKHSIEQQAQEEVKGISWEKAKEIHKYMCWLDTSFDMKTKAEDKRIKAIEGLKELGVAIDD